MTQAQQAPQRIEHTGLVINKDYARRIHVPSLSLQIKSEPLKSGQYGRL
jgi:hypothetical protein